MNTFAGIWIFALSLTQLYHVQAAPEVKVTVFYETLCPDSIRFIQRQLYPTYTVLGDHMNVEFVPFGKADYSTDPWSYSCQHGRHECYGNTVQACALAKYPENQKQVEFINCVMSSKFPPKSGKKCASRLKYSYSGIEECATSEEGKRLVAEMGNRTKNFSERLSFVPTILFDDKYNWRNQKEALSDLKSVVCKQLNSAVSQCQ